ncbi:MAG: M56 family metallopeptidase [Coriobacteriia bacterium]|nr:M56 family metallopeptidase [Coriobacteriia bacterium]
MDKAFITVVNMSLTGVFVIIAVCLARIPLKKAPKLVSYCLWAVVGFRLLFPFSVQSAFSLLPINPKPIPTDIGMQSSPYIDTGIDAIDQAVNTVLPEAGLTAEGAGPLSAWAAAFSWAWAVGMTAMAVFGIASYVRLKRKMASANEVGEGVYESARAASPFMLGLAKPRIYLPIGISPDEREYVVAHERIHLQRRDHLVKCAAYLILCLHWFNPFAWLAFLLMGVDMELSCDERVLKDLGAGIKKKYSMSLLAMASSHWPVSTSPLSFSEGGLKERIKNVMGFKKPSRMLVVLSVAVALVVGLGFALDRANNAEAGLYAPDIPEETPLVTVYIGGEKTGLVEHGSRQASLPAGLDPLELLHSISNEDISQPGLAAGREGSFQQVVAGTAVVDLPYVADGGRITISAGDADVEAIVTYSYILGSDGLPLSFGSGDLSVIQPDYPGDLASESFMESSMAVSANAAPEVIVDGFMLRGYFISIYIDGTAYEYLLVVRLDAPTVVTSLEPRDNFPINEAGKTYGAKIYVADLHVVITPEMIAVAATNGESGYADLDDMYGFGSNNPVSQAEAGLEMEVTNENLSPEQAFIRSVEAQTGVSLDVDAVNEAFVGVKGARGSLRLYKYLPQADKDALLGLLPVGYRSEQVVVNAYQLAYRSKGVSIPVYQSDGVTVIGEFVCGDQIGLVLSVSAASSGTVARLPGYLIMK